MRKISDETKYVVTDPNLTFKLSNFLEDSVFIFQFFNDEIHNYVKQNIIVSFIIQKLKNKCTFIKKLPN